LPRLFPCPAIILATLTLVLPVSAQGGTGQTDKVDLSPRWIAGAEAVFEYTSDSTRLDAVPAMATKQEQRTRQEMTVRRKVIETGSAGTVLELVFERIKVVITQGRTFMLYDTRKPPAADRSNALEHAIKPVLNQPIRVVLGADNSVREITGIPPPLTIEGTVRPLVIDQELVRDSLGGLYGLQKQPPQAKVGESWLLTEDLPSGPDARFIIRHKRTLNAVTDGLASVTSSASGEIKPVDPAKPSGKRLAEFACTTQHEWDIARGRLGWMVLEQKTVRHGVVRQARSEHTSTVRITLAAEGFSPPPPPPSDGPADDPPGAAPSLNNQRPQPPR